MSSSDITSICSVVFIILLIIFILVPDCSRNIRTFDIFWSCDSYWNNIILCFLPINRNKGISIQVYWFSGDNHICLINRNKGISIQEIPYYFSIAKHLSLLTCTAQKLYAIPQVAAIVWLVGNNPNQLIAYHATIEAVGAPVVQYVVHLL